MAIYGYCRVSTKNQLDGYSLEAQEREILNKYPDAEIYKEQYTGTSLDRPELKRVLDSLKENDLLVVTKLDRLARNTVEGIQTIQGLFDRGVAVHILNVGLLEDTSMGKFFLTTLLAIAELERNSIIERCQQGKEIARTRKGYREGRPRKFTDKQLEMALDLLKEYSYKQVSTMTNISVSSLIRAKQKMK